MAAATAPARTKRRTRGAAAEEPAAAAPAPAPAPAGRGKKRGGGKASDLGVTERVLATAPPTAQMASAGWGIQVGAFSQAAQAEQLARQAAQQLPTSALLAAAARLLILSSFHRLNGS